MGVAQGWVLQEDGCCTRMGDADGRVLQGDAGEVWVLRKVGSCRWVMQKGGGEGWVLHEDGSCGGMGAAGGWVMQMGGM